LGYLIPIIPLPSWLKLNLKNQQIFRKKYPKNLRISYVLWILVYYNPGKVIPVEFVVCSFLSLLENLNKKRNEPIAIIK